MLLIKLTTDYVVVAHVVFAAELPAAQSPFDDLIGTPSLSGCLCCAAVLAVVVIVVVDVDVCCC